MKSSLLASKQPIPTNWVSREDLLFCCPSLEKQIEAMTPDEIEHIASKIGDLLQETYWTLMDIALHEYFAIPDEETDTNQPT